MISMRGYDEKGVEEAEEMRMKEDEPHVMRIWGENEWRTRMRWADERGQCLPGPVD